MEILFVNPLVITSENFLRSSQRISEVVLVAIPLGNNLSNPLEF